jgi:hypothetical protein
VGTEPQQLFGVGIGVGAASRAASRALYALERRHEDGRHWIVLRRFPARDEAEAALRALVDAGEAPPEDLRVRKIRTGS